MSHITTIKSKVDFADELILQRALDKTKETIAGFDYEQVKRDYQVKCSAINHSYAKKNMLFKHSTNAKGKDVWSIRGDRFSVSTEFDRIQQEIEHHYRVISVQSVMTKNMYQIQSTPVKEGMLILAQRY